MKHPYALYLLISAFLPVFSCTHWLIDTETRIQVENGTSKEIHSLSLVSEEGKFTILVPDALRASDPPKADTTSKIYTKELVGKFNFVIYSGDSLIPLGWHELEGGSVLVQIKEKNDSLFAIFK